MTPHYELSSLTSVFSRFLILSPDQGEITPICQSIDQVVQTFLTGKMREEHLLTGVSGRLSFPFARILIFLRNKDCSKKKGP